MEAVARSRRDRRAGGDGRRDVLRRPTAHRLRGPARGRSGLPVPVRSRIEDADGFREPFLEYVAEHSIAGQVSAVRNEDVYRAGRFYQGPIVDLSLTERAARRLYPDRFDRNEQLYDRERIGEIVAWSV